ncbi:hypothetical protein TWF281_011342 [Arthrobotrys megalospora]
MYCYATGPPPRTLRPEPHTIFKTSQDVMARIWDSYGKEEVSPLSVCAGMWCSIDCGKVLRENLKRNFANVFRFLRKDASAKEILSALRASEFDIRYMRMKREEESEYFEWVSDVLNVLLKDTNGHLILSEQVVQTMKIYFKEAVENFSTRYREASMVSRYWRLIKLLINNGAPFDPDADGKKLILAFAKTIDEHHPPIRMPIDVDYPNVQDISDLLRELLDLGVSMAENGAEELSIAVRIRHLDLFHKLIGGRIETLEQVDQSGRSFMHILFQKDWARGGGNKCPGGLVPLFNILYEFQPDLVNAQDNQSRAPLSYATELRDLEGVELLLEHGADVYDDDELGQTALHTLCCDDYAVERGDKFTWIEDKNRDSVPLPWQCGPHNDSPAVDNAIGILRRLDEASADSNARTKSQATPIALAFQCQRPRFLSAYLQILTQTYPRESQLAILLSRDVDNRNILHYAMKRDTLTCEKKRKELLQVIRELFRSLEKEEQEFLLNGKELSHGFTPLHEAAKMGYLELLHLFVAYNADVYLKSAEGLTAIEYLINEKGYEAAMVDRCDHRTGAVDLGKDVDHGNKDTTSSDDEDLLLALLGDLRRTEQNSMLFGNLRSIAVQMNWGTLLEALSKHNIDPLSLDDHGWNELHVAAVFNGMWIKSPAADGGRSVPDIEPNRRPSRFTHIPQRVFGYLSSPEGIELEADNLEIRFLHWFSGSQRK